MTPCRRRLRTALRGLRILAAGSILLAGLGVGLLIKYLKPSRVSPPPDRVAAVIWVIALLGAGVGARFFLVKTSYILKKFERLGGSFSPREKPARSASGGEEEEKKHG
jgi:hypothetical protein